MKILGIDYFFLRDRVALPLLRSENKLVTTTAKFAVHVLAWPHKFDSHVYLESNPDVHMANLNPNMHALLMGLREGRLTSAGPIDCSSGGTRHDPNRKNVLVVSHEASRTGAPIVALGLVRELRKKYNVVTLLLGGGELEQDFREESVLLYRDYVARRSDLGFQTKLNKVLQKHAPEFAVVNSLESRVVFASLSLVKVPSVGLIHEYVSYTKPTSGVSNALRNSDYWVFSSELTQQDAVKVLGTAVKSKSAIIPQGRVLNPKSTKRAGAAAEPLFRASSNRSSDVIKVLGAGYIQYRKGVDLFIECARQLTINSPKTKFEFVWLGDGYKPETDMGYSVYLADQINRSGISDTVRIVEARSDFTEILKEADILLLTSRLDPLPNVVIDALSEGIPTFTFDKASGFPKIFRNWGLDGILVADYLDVTEMAQKAANLICSPSTRDKVGSSLKEKARVEFGFESYVKQIEDVALEIQRQNLSINER